MVVLRGSLVVFAASGLAACYSPSLRDCAVECTAEADCARGQVCGSAHLCAAPDVADHCGEVVADAGVDSRPPIDALLHVSLHLKIDGEGEVSFAGGTCMSGGSQNGNCTYSVVVGIPITLSANDIDTHTFDKWTSGPCINQTARTCAVTPTVALDIHARWH